MSDTFSISVDEWLGPGSNTSAELATHAEISIRVGAVSATQVEDLIAKTVRPSIRVSAEPLAKWLLMNWWRLKYETEPVVAQLPHSWAMSHSLAAVGEGYVWPDLIFRGSDGVQIAIECKRHLSAGNDGFSPVRFLNSFRSSISVEDFESNTRLFIEAVLARLSNVGIRDGELHDLWKDLNIEWTNPQYSSHRRLEALLGLEPDENDGLISAVVKWGKRFGWHAAEEIAAESNSDEITSILDQSRILASETKTYADIRDIEGLAVTSKESEDAVPWKRAQALAYALRDKWELGDRPLLDKDLAERLSLPPLKLKESNPNAPLSLGVRGKLPGKLGLRLNRPHDHGRRFDTARLIGDYLGFDQEERILPATNAMTNRQKFQRAFAAELLCPSRMIEQRYSGLDQRTVAKAVDEISTDYVVAEQVVIHHMENRHVLAQKLPSGDLLMA